MRTFFNPPSFLGRLQALATRVQTFCAKATVEGFDEGIVSWLFLVGEKSSVTQLGDTTRSPGRHECVTTIRLSPDSFQHLEDRGAAEWTDAAAAPARSELDRWLGYHKFRGWCQQQQRRAVVEVDIAGCVERDYYPAPCRRVRHGCESAGLHDIGFNQSGMRQ